MIPVFEELDFQSTPLGDISLRKRSEPRLDHQLIYEVKLNDDFLMSSLFVEAEEQLSKLALQRLQKVGRISSLNVVVGGLGLGYTALAALEDQAVSKLTVIDVMQPVIDWHRRGILPMGDVLAKSNKCTLVHGDFFAIATAEQVGFNGTELVDAILLDIDHTPEHWLHESNQNFYQTESLMKMADKLSPLGVFGLWSNEAPSMEFMERLKQVFTHVEGHVVAFPNPYSGGESINAVYLASAP